MKLALHRSITFWSGLLVMGFVCWAWWDSTKLSSSAWVDPYWGVNLWSGIRIDHTFVEPGSNPAFGIDRQTIEPFWPVSPEVLPNPFFVRSGTPDAEMFTNDYTHEEYIRHLSAMEEPGQWSLFLPHWLILLTVAALWLGLLFWRARRRRKAAA